MSNIFLFIKDQFKELRILFLCNRYKAAIRRGDIAAYSKLWESARQLIMSRSYVQIKRMEKRL